MADSAKELQFKFSLIEDQLPSFFADDDQSMFKELLEKYYLFMECYDIQYSSLILDEPGVQTQHGEDVQTEYSTDVLRESDRTANSTFIVGERITGAVTGATAVVRGVQENGVQSGGSTSTAPHQIWATPENGQSFAELETFTGSETRAKATISTLKINPIYAVKDFFNNLDINTYQPVYKKYFRSEFIPNVPIDVLLNFSSTIKQILEVYRSKGTEAAYRWLWRALYNSENLEFYYPRNNVLRISGGKWIQQNALKVDLQSAVKVGGFVSKKVTGFISRATAIVESYREVTLQQSTVGEITISNQLGNFQAGEVITTDVDKDGNISSGVLLSVVQSIEIQSGGTNYQIGDVVYFTGGGGVGANAAVTAIKDGVIDSYVIDDGGEGFIAGDQLSFGGGSPVTEASGSVGTVVETGKYFYSTTLVATYTATLINAADYGGAFAGKNANSHLYSNVQTTFIATVDDTTGFTKGLTLTEQTVACGAQGTSIAIPNTTQLVYAIPDPDSPQFLQGNNASVIVAAYANGDVVATVNCLVNVIASSANTDYYGTLYESTGNWQSYGAIKTIDVSSAGSGYVEKPSITVQNLVVSALHPSRFSERSRILQFQENVTGDYILGDIVEGNTSFTKGTVLDPVIESSVNTTFSQLRYLPQEVTLDLDSTDGSADAGDALLLEDSFNPAHGSYTSNTSVDGYLLGEVTRFEDNEVINVQRSVLILSNTATSNADYDDGKTLGLNANIGVGVLTIGAISELEVSNPGLGYGSPPSIVANTGDNNAILTAITGPLNIYPSRYEGTAGLLNEADKIQDSLYYQDFSYVIKTDVPINIFRDTVKGFTHPAGYALFGEIAIRTFMQSKLSIPSNFSYVAREYTPAKMSTPLNVSTAGQQHYEPQISMYGTTNVQVTMTSDLLELQFVNYSSATPVLVVGPTDANDAFATWVEVETGEPDFANVQIQRSDSSVSDIEYILPKVNLSMNARQMAEGHGSMISVAHPVYGHAFLTYGDDEVRLNPSIQEFVTLHESTTTAELIQWYAGENILDIHSCPSTSNAAILTLEEKQILMPSINIELEDDEYILHEDGTTQMGLEDGLNPLDGSYTTTSAQGKIEEEVQILMAEDNMPLAIYDGLEKIFSVKDINITAASNSGAYSTSFTITSPDGVYLNESFLSMHRFYTHPFSPVV